jgi:hypothetical protein
MSARAAHWVISAFGVGVAVGVFVELLRPKRRSRPRTTTVVAASEISREDEHVLAA